ncbi:MAG: hypothetical protein U9O87_04765 [Verrucomicrobiota bacterium]|nr:hypothetical protein [Verrucomicrobiota bacterium]
MKDTTQFARIRSYITNAVKNERIGHAYLLSCDNLQEAENFCKFFIKTILCKNLTSNNGPCNKCQKCTQIEKNTYPYKLELKPKSKSRSIVVKSIIEMENFFHRRIPEGYIRVGIIHEADRMNEETQNKFLKTLEEPAPRSIIFLITREIKQLLPTIISRTQTIPLRENKYNYDFEESELLFDILASVIPYSGAKIGLLATKKINKIFKTLRDKAKKLVNDSNDTDKIYWEKEAKSDKKLAKLLSEEESALTESIYLKLRTQVLSAIHCWYSQLLLLASGIKIDDLPNPEIFHSRKKDWINNLKINDAEYSLALADRLFTNLVSYNVRDDIEINDFMLQLTKKSH